jgi:EAL domain-containing protein (putative c-di-GMP-specific phosphodiesterase class I)
LDDVAIATAIIAMARSLQHTVIAEGVETEAQFAFLREQGCEEIQGYYFSKPLPVEEFVKLIGKSDPFTQQKIA